MPYAYYWYGRQRYRFKWYEDLDIPDKGIKPIPKQYRYSTRNLNYNPNKTEYIHKIRYLPDDSEVACGYYLYPRYFNGTKVNKKFWGAPVNVFSSGLSGIWPFQYVTAKYSDFYYREISKDANLDRMLHYKENQCPISVIIGKMGSGKSTILNYFINLCLGNNEAVLMAGDVFCEWKNLAITGKIKYDDGIGYYVDLHPVEVCYHKNDKKMLFVNRINRPNISYHMFEGPEDIITRLAPGKVVIVYDDNFTERAQLSFWSQIASLLNRRKPDFTVAFTHHEIGKLLPMHATSAGFEGVQNFSKELVHFRKADVRFIGCSQLLSEVFWRISQKMIYIIYKQGDRNDWIRDPVKKRMVMELAIDEMIVENAGSYSLHNSPMFPELKTKMRMIGQKKINTNFITGKEAPDGYMSKEELKEYKIKLAFKMREVGLTLRNIGKILDVHYSTISHWIEKIEKEKTNKYILNQKAVEVAQSGD